MYMYVCLINEEDELCKTFQRCLQLSFFIGHCMNL